MPRPAAKPRPATLSLGDFLPYQLSVVTEAVSALIARGYERQFGISIPEWRVLAVIGERGSLCTQDVIDRTRMDRVRVSRAVIRLTDKGLITRKPDPQDARAQILDFSAEGSAIYRKIVPLARAIQSELAASLSAAEVKQLGTILRKLDRCAKAMDAREDDTGG